MLNHKLVGEIEALQKKINSLVLANKDGAKNQEIISISEQLAKIALQEDAQAYVVNITDVTLTFDRSYGRPCIYGVGDRNNPHYQEGKPYAVTYVEMQHEVMDVLKGLKTMRFAKRYERDPMQEATVVNGIEVSHPAILVAKDLVFNMNDGLPLAYDALKQYGAEATAGVFISDTPVPDPRELKEMQQQMEKYQRALVALGDVQWRRKPDSREIYDSQRRACDALGLSREWHSLPTPNAICPGCGASIPNGIAVHTASDCGAVIDEQKAISLHMIPDPKKPPIQPRA